MYHPIPTLLAPLVTISSQFCHQILKKLWKYLPQIDMPKCIRHIYLQEVNLTVSMYPSNLLYLFPAIISAFALLLWDSLTPVSISNNICDNSKSKYEMAYPWDSHSLIFARFVMSLYSFQFLLCYSIGQKIYWLNLWMVFMKTLSKMNTLSLGSTWIYLSSLNSM